MNGKTVLAERRYELDWLRVGAILTVFIYHSARFFDGEDWSVKNAVTHLAVSQWQVFLAQWMMPLIFLISGASAYFAVGKSGPGRFIWDKALRLLVPVLVAAFTHASLQVYLERLSHGQFHGSYWEFLPHYFDGVYLGPGTGTGNFAFHGMHLWYLLFLFLFCLLVLPLFFWLRGELGGRALRKVGDVLALPGAVLFLALPTAILQNVLGHDTLLGGFRLGGWNMPHYLWFFVSGFLILSHQRLQRRICQARWVALALGLALVIVPLLSGGEVGKHPDLVSWSWILAILGFGLRHLNFRNPFLSYANDTVMPFYILHQSVLLFLGFFVVQWAVTDLARYVTITVLSFFTIVMLCEFLVRRNNVIRFLFGMSARQRAAQSAHLSLPS